MKSNISQSPLRTYSAIPKKWPTYNGELYNTLSSVRHLEDGWRDVVIPVINSETERLGGLVILNDTVTYQVIQKTAEELKQEVVNRIESNREEVIQKEVKESIVKQIQLKEGSEALKYKYAYPIWQEGIKCDLNSKYIYLIGTTMKLYKCLTAHIASSSFIPNVATSHFSEIKEDILVWEAGINAIKDRLYSFNGKFYRCLENHLTVAGQDPTKVKAYWLEEKL